MAVYYLFKRYNPEIALDYTLPSLPKFSIHIDPMVLTMGCAVLFLLIGDTLFRSYRFKKTQQNNNIK
ncbi:hypothetical protein M2138_000020 [Dysgonomonadaceae bacterium PH5-43]|nr:hypothetical protein [Dysgonomonadaceae bacterium PH5-43]